MRLEDDDLEPQLLKYESIRVEFEFELPDKIFSRTRGMVETNGNESIALQAETSSSR